MTQVSSYVLGVMVTRVSEKCDTCVSFAPYTPIWWPLVYIYMAVTIPYLLRKHIYMPGGHIYVKFFARAARAQRALYFYIVHPIYALGT